MEKKKAVRMKPGTLVLFEDERKILKSGQRLGRVEHVTAKGGVLVTPVVEVYSNPITLSVIGPAEWLPYSKVQLSNCTYAIEARTGEPWDT